MKYFVGVEIGVTQISVGIVDKYGRLINKDIRANSNVRHYTEIIKNAVDMTEVLLDKEGIDIKNVKCIGVGCPGIPNDKDGVLVRNYTLNFQNIPIRAEFQKYFKLPVYVDNDANCAALAESVAGAAEDIDYSVTVRIGTGIGGGIIIHNKIYTGFNFAGAELGHMVISMGGEKCTCGRKGCWEAYAAVPALIKQTRDAAVQNPQSLIHKITDGDLTKINEFTAYEAQKQGDPGGKEVFDRYLEYLAEGITNLINILMPEAIIIGGQISKLGEGLLQPLRKLVAERVYAKEVSQPEFKTAEIGSSAVMIGAAMLGLYKDR
ncbi:MAG: ROK family protein [Clostridia bacterium]|nr:ROK family protein [Clostridia bacterium]